jgi:DNA-binding NarL/FixJ family response regulator
MGEFHATTPQEQDLNGPNDMRSIRVVIADDHPLFREGLREVLEKLCHIEVVGEAGDGEEAVSVAREFHPDVVLMDMDMPRMLGDAATRRITTEMPEVKTIALSMSDDPSTQRKMRAAGAVQFVAKGCGPEVLCRAIHRAVA